MCPAALSTLSVPGQPRFPQVGRATVLPGRMRNVLPGQQVARFLRGLVPRPLGSFDAIPTAGIDPGGIAGQTRGHIRRIVHPSPCVTIAEYLPHRR